MIYARAVPEKWKPGRFDLWFSSHNLFHVLVLMGAVVHYRAALVLLAWRDHHGCGRRHHAPPVVRRFRKRGVRVLWPRVLFVAALAKSFVILLRT